MFFEACDIWNLVLIVLSDLKIFRMETQNTGTTPSKSNQLRNVNTSILESRNITTQPGKLTVFAFVVYSSMNVTANNFYI